MSTDNDVSTDLALPDPLEQLKTRLRRQQVLLLALAGICVLALLSALTALAMLMGDEEPAAAQTETLQTQATEMSEQMMLVSSQVELLLAATTQTSAEVEELGKRLDAVDMNDQNNAMVRLQRILIRQERDYRDFLVSLENGLYNFHMMIPHSRGWWDDYKEELARSSELSKARENYVVNLRAN